VTRYQSKRDPWSVALLLFATLAAASASIPILSTSLAVLGKMLAIVICLTGAGITLSFLLWTHYDLGNGMLIICHGPLRWRIPIGAIHSVSPASNFLSSAALSTDRLRLRYGEGFSEIYIFPADRTGFVQQLADMMPDHRLQGESVVHSNAHSKGMQRTDFAPADAERSVRRKIEAAGPIRAARPESEGVRVLSVNIIRMSARRPA
jgi:hypothetical protein